MHLVAPTLAEMVGVHLRCALAADSGCGPRNSRTPTLEERGSRGRSGGAELPSLAFMKLQVSKLNRTTA